MLNSRLKFGGKKIFFTILYRSLAHTNGTPEHLGLYLDSKLSFVSHINEKNNKAKTLIGILKYLSQHLPLKTLDQMYKIFIRPHFDFCDPIYHTPQVTNPFESSITLNALMERVEKIQYQALLAITGTWQGTSRNKLYDELGWKSLSDRRRCRRLIHLFKIRNNMTPNLKENLPLKRSLLFRNLIPISLMKHHVIQTDI